MYRPLLNRPIVRVGIAVMVEVLVAMLPTPGRTDEKPDLSRENKVLVKRVEPKAKTPHEPEWLPVREVLAASLILEFAVTEEQPGRPPTRQIRRQHAVCLRAVFPRQEQVEKIVAALPAMAEAAQQPLAEPELLGLHTRKGALLENARRTVDATRASPVRQPKVDDLLLIKFTVERQQAEEKPAAWDKLTWEEVAIERSIAVLAAAENFDEEIAQPAECSVDITSPLPRLDHGKWDEWVLHPRLKENRLAVRQPTTTEKQMLQESHSESETARYLLLRYFDFEAMYGRSYRYRIKILYRNPAFEVTDVPPEMAEGEFRESPWSEPSPAVTVGK